MKVLNPDDRLVLINALRPPPGTSLVRAVATTFTLDLEAAMTVPLAFASHRLRDANDGISVMEAIRECADRIDIFGQAGQLRDPVTRSSLFAYLEPMVHLVHARGRLFHPKVWVVSFGDDETGERAVRLLVLTRNLTSDRSWDLCLTLDGRVTPTVDPANSPIVDLVRWCTGHVIGPSLGRERRAGINALLRDVSRAAWELPQQATAMSFHALGVGRPVSLDFSGTRHLAISPFVTPGGLALVAPSTRPTVISRQEELDRLPEEVAAQLDAYVLDESAALREDGSGGPVSGVLAGLHAKAFVTEYNRQAWLTVGSANATDPGLSSNVEFVVQLRGSRTAFGVEAITGAQGMENMLLPYARRPVAAEDDGMRQLEASLARAAILPFDAVVTGKEDDWTLLLTTEVALRNPPEVTVQAGLLTRAGDAQALPGGEIVSAHFHALRTVEVTPFVVLTARAGDLTARTVVRATLHNDPHDRLDAILASQIDSPEKFLRWLYLLLGQSELLLQLGEGVPAGGSTMWERMTSRGLLETLLLGLADNPAQLRGVSRFVRRVRATAQGREVLPPGFTGLWDLVDQARVVATASVAE